MDISLKFSSEMLVLGLVFVVGGLNIYYFGFFHTRMYTDDSHAAKLLSYHVSLNNKLYAKETSINTVMVSPGGFISQASADDFQGLNANDSYFDNSDDFGLVINENAIVKPNPDSVDSLIAKQIKIYETKDKDTLSSVATANGITVQTLADANKISTSTVLKPGWQLIILPTNGVLVKATSNDTLPDIAKKYSGNLDTIISYNGLENAEDITAGQLIIVPGGHMPLPPAPKPQAKPKPKTDPSKVGGSGVATPRVYDEGTGHLFPWGYCTYYVSTKVHVPWGGNAKSWLANAKAYGAVVSNTPAVGSIVVTNDSRRYGHVALVEQVEDDRFLVSEMNYEKFGKVDYRWIPIGSSSVKGFIHP